jgi:hypothetical protein
VELDTAKGEPTRRVSFVVGPDREAGEFNAVRLGYSGTIYKGQGRTLDQTYVFHSHYWREASSYVALTRHRESVAIFVAHDTAADLDRLARQMGRDEIKRAALSFVVSDERERGQAGDDAGARQPRTRSQDQREPQLVRTPRKNKPPSGWLPRRGSAGRGCHVGGPSGAGSRRPGTQSVVSPRNGGGLNGVSLNRRRTNLPGIAVRTWSDSPGGIMGKRRPGLHYAPPDQAANRAVRLAAFAGCCVARRRACPHHGAADDGAGSLRPALAGARRAPRTDL